MAVIKGNANNNVLVGSSADDDIYGYEGNDVLIGSGGDDYLNGGIGEDTMDGGIGNDLYVVDDFDDEVVEYANNGNDTISASISYNLTWANNVENLVLSGSADIDGYGTAVGNDLYGNSGDNDLFGFAGNDILKGGGGDDYLNGGTGNDTMLGGSGDDYYVVSSSADTVTESAGLGLDTVSSSVTHTLAANVENLVLTGSGNINGYGNELSNEITGNSGNNDLEGGSGADEMHGGVGNDTIDGGEGIDEMYGGEGDDRFAVDTLDDQVIEYDDDGIDTVQTTFFSGNYTLPVNVENLFLYFEAYGNGTGNVLENIIHGSVNGNTLDGGLGKDMMYGDDGDDTYYVDQTDDIAFEEESHGNDVVFSIANYTLGAYIETLSLDGGTAVSGTGNAQGNTIFGNTQDNVLDGGGGSDALSGLGGSDTFVFQAGQANGDVVYEFEGNGAGVGDLLKFVGYGPGAALIQQTASEWLVSSADGSIQEIFTLVGAPSIDPTDFLFV